MTKNFKKKHMFCSKLSLREMSGIQKTDLSFTICKMLQKNDSAELSSFVILTVKKYFHLVTDSLLKWHGRSKRPTHGRMQGEFDIPKFQRLKAVHLYFWYLAWGHESEEIEVNSSKPIVYSDSDDWKTFVPPISHPSNMSEGWLNIGEAYLHVPLSIFRKFAPGAMYPFKVMVNKTMASVYFI